MSIPFVKQFDDFAEAMAVPNPNRPIQEAAASFGRSVCDAISARPGTFAPTVLQSPLKAACQPYWDGQDYDGPVEQPPDFPGGQCTYNYVVGFLANRQPEFRDDWSTFVSGPGPVSSITKVSGPNPANPSQTLTTFTVVFSDATRTANVNSASGNTGFFLLLPSNPSDLDDCGDLPTEFVPGGNPAPDPGPLPPGTGPSFDIRGNPIVVLPPTFQLSPDINIQFPPGEVDLGGGTGGGPAQPPAPGAQEEGEGSGTGGSDNDFGEPPDGERWVGCCVTITSEPPGAGSIPQAEPESIYPRTIGNVRLKFAGSSGLAEYDTPIVNRQKTTCVWEPVRGLTPIGVRVNLLPGYNYAYRPYSIPLEQ